MGHMFDGVLLKRVRRRVVVSCVVVPKQMHICKPEGVLIEANWILAVGFVGWRLRAIGLSHLAP